MPTTLFEQSRIDFPDLSQRLIDFFEMRNAPIVNNAMRPKSVTDFLREFQNSFPNSGLQPRVIVEICRRLVRQGWLGEVSIGGFEGLDNQYYSIRRNNLTSTSSPSIGRMLSCAVYGFPAVHQHYAASVLPLINWNDDDDQQIGTCFVGGAYLVFTALHCIQPASGFAIRGVSAEAFDHARFYAPSNNLLDIAVIIFDKPVFQSFPAIPIPREPAQILDEVMALGYPNLPGFVPSLAAEAANISGRLTATRGRVASAPTEIFAQAELFLITARVRGGFSGGPVLDTFGQAAGIISREPAADANLTQGQRYDDLGYGTAIPASHAVELLDLVGSSSIQPLDMASVQFRAFS